jgi:anthranilate phosphoribosyltransferase
MDVREAIAQLVGGRHLSEGEMEAVMRGVMGGEATPAQIGAFMVALRIQGESVDELTGAARVMRRYATRVHTTKDVLDTCGTGGDLRGTFNISTAAAFIAAGAGIVVAKHGNRAMSGAVGGADVLEALGVRIDVEAGQVSACLEDAGIGFLFAPVFHPAMRHAAQPRREIGIRTIFNLLGPLSNPAGAHFQLLGVFNAAWLEPLARTLGKLGSRRVMVVHGDDGLDEISLTGPSQVAELRDGNVTTYSVAPEDLGIERCAPEDLRGGDVAHNADIIRKILAGDATRAQTDIAVLNAAGAIYVAERAPDMRQAVDAARESISSGRAAQKLEQLIDLSQR